MTKAQAIREATQIRDRDLESMVVIEKLHEADRANRFSWIPLVDLHLVDEAQVVISIDPLRG